MYHFISLILVKIDYLSTHFVNIRVILSVDIHMYRYRGVGTLGLSVVPASGTSGVRIPAAKDLSRKIDRDSPSAQRSSIGGSDHYKRIPCVTVGVAR